MSNSFADGWPISTVGVQECGQAGFPGVPHVCPGQSLGVVSKALSDGIEQRLMFLDCLLYTFRILEGTASEATNRVLDEGQKPLQIGVVARLTNQVVELEVDSGQARRAVQARLVSEPLVSVGQ